MATSAPDYSGFDYSSGNLAAIGHSTIADTSGGGGWLSGLQDVFGAAATAFTNVYRTVNQPKPQQVPAGSAIYDPQTGQYKQALAGLSMNPTTMLLLVGGAIVVVLALRGK